MCTRSTTFLQTTCSLALVGMKTILLAEGTTDSSTQMSWRTTRTFSLKKVHSIRMILSTELPREIMTSQRCSLTNRLRTHVERMRIILKLLKTRRMWLVFSRVSSKLSLKKEEKLIKPKRRRLSTNLDSRSTLFHSRS